MKWIIDTDPVIDDAAALIASLKLGILDVVGITAVHGNVDLDLTVRNALKLVELLDSPVPVYRGCERALLEIARRSPEYHGDDGFGNTHLSAPARTPESSHAVDFIIDTAHHLKGGLSILTLGPLTNLAVALAKDRSIAREIAAIVMMGGTSRARGNTSAVAEFNVFADPEAAQLVFQSGIPVKMVPWETCMDAMLGPEVVAAARESKNPAGRAFSKAAEMVVSRIKARVGTEGLLLCDLVAAALAMDDSVAVERRVARIDVETGGTYSRGLTVIDERPESAGRATVEVCLSCDKSKVQDMFLTALKSN